MMKMLGLLAQLYHQRMNYELCFRCLYCVVADLRAKAFIGVVGGSDLSKQVEQLGKNGAVPACLPFSPHHHRPVFSSVVFSPWCV